MNWPYEPPPAGPVPVADVETVLPRHRRSRWRVWVALAAVLAVATGVTAVALTRSDGKSTVAILESAPGNTRSAGTAQLTSTISFTIGGETRAVVRIDGRNNFLDKQADVSVRAKAFARRSASSAASSTCRRTSSRCPAARRGCGSTRRPTLVSTRPGRRSVRAIRRPDSTSSPR